MSRDQPLKAPRYAESRPLQASTVAARRSSDVTSDVIVHKVPEDQLKPPLRAANAAPGGPAERTESEQRASQDLVKSTEQRGHLNTATSQKHAEHSTHADTSGNLERSSLKANDDAIKCQPASTTQPTTKLRPLSRESSEKPARHKPKPEMTSTVKTSDTVIRKPSSAGRVETEAKVTQSKPVSSCQPSSGEPQTVTVVKPKPAAALGVPVSVNRAKNQDTFSVHDVRSEPVKASPVKVQCKPRRQTRATLAYDRVMFFSDFFRRLESDRRLFALTPVRRNRVYVRPRAEDTSPAPVKFPRPTATKKGRTGVVTAAGNTSVRSSPFNAKRRLPSQRWDHKIDLESIEADATSTAQPSRNQLPISMNHQ